MQFGNPLVAGAQVTQGQIVSLGQVVSPGSATALINASITNGPFSGILIHVHNPGGATVGIGLWASVTNGEGHTFSGALPPQPTVAALALTDYYGIIPCECGVADALQIQVQFGAQPPANTVVNAYGLTDGRPQLMRPDGRMYPIGARITGAYSLVAGSQTMLAAPANGRYLLKKIGARSVNGTSVDVQGTVNGAVSELLGVASGGGQIVVEYESGLLLDPATAVTFNNSATQGGGGEVTYDIVPS